MRRVWLVLGLIAVLGGSVFGQNLTGSWVLDLSLLPTLGLTSTSLQLAYTVSGWTLKSESEFTTDAWVWQTLGAQGNFGPLKIDGDMLFGPVLPDFLYGQLFLGTSLAGVEAELWTAMAGEAILGPSGGAVIRLRREVDGVVITSTTGIGAWLPEEGFTITYTPSGLTKTYAVDPFPGGFQFTREELSVGGIPFSCGITLDVSFAFTKEEGFDYLTFTAKNLLAFCCDIGLDASVTFTTTGKEVELRPYWEGIEGCFTIYGDVQYGAGLLGGLEIYGFRLRCDLAECNYVEFLTALDVEKIEDILQEDIFEEDEFEYVKLGFCGPGCCGGEYTVDVAVYFQDITGPLFGITRLGAEISIPIMANFTLQSSFGVGVGGETSLSLGWTFTF